MEGSGAFNTGQAYTPLEVANMTPTSEYRIIPLTQGQVALVDAADYDWIMEWKWCAHWDSSGGRFYAVRSRREGKRTIHMAMPDSFSD